MAIVGDAFDGAPAGFLLATALAAVLAGGLILNVFLQPARTQLASTATEFRSAET